MTSSPRTPSPRVAPRTSAPFSYSSEIETPSIFSSASYSTAPPRRAQAAADALVPLAQLVERIRVLDREHRRLVDDGRKRSRSSAPPTRCVGEFGSSILRMLRLQLLQPPQHLIEVEVADLRRAFVVEAVVAFELGAEVGDFLLRLHLRA